MAGRQGRVGAKCHGIGHEICHASSTLRVATLPSRLRGPAMKLTFKQVNSVAVWKWHIPSDDEGRPDPLDLPPERREEEDEDVCGICRVAYDGCCPDCKLPGDDCPLSASLDLADCEMSRAERGRQSGDNAHTFSICTASSNGSTRTLRSNSVRWTEDHGVRHRSLRPRSD